VFNGLVIDNCASLPCENGASCNNNIGTFTCDCVTGYTGETCEAGQWFNVINCKSNIKNCIKIELGIKD
jgi:hypothetical protein